MGLFNKVLVQLVVFGVLAVSTDCLATCEGWVLVTFKDAIYEEPGMFLSNWNPLDQDPCGWSGVWCSSARDHVTKINITGASLKGFLTRELGLLSYLQELILNDNNLLGIIPKELGLLKNLEVMDLGQNQLSGPIPHEIGNLTNIRKINLESNGLTGRLPAELANLMKLEELYLDRNKLQGTFPAVSGSDFTASTHGISSFQGNCLQNKDPKQPSRAHWGRSLRHVAITVDIQPCIDRRDCYVLCNSSNPMKCVFCTLYQCDCRC